MRIQTLGLLLALAVSQAAPARAAALPAPYASVEGVSEYRLDNGLRLLLAPDASQAAITVNLTYLVGSRHESYGETGMAHLLEHMMFKGTARIANVMDELSRRGMQANATTFLDRTNYFETFPADDDNLAWALRMEADRMTDSRIARADLDREFSVVRNEMEMGESDPFRALWKQLTAVSFDWHNYGHNTIGARSDVEKVRIDNLRAFYRKYYQPDNAVLVISGRFDPARALALTRDSLGAVPRPARALTPTWTEEPQRDGARKVTVRRAGDTTLLAALYHASAGSHPDWAALQALDHILTNAPSGRLYQALVDGRHAVKVSALSPALAEPGYVSYWATLSKGQKPAEARRVMLATLEDIRRHPIVQAELDRARAAWLNQFEQTVSDPQALSLALTEAIALGDWRLFFLERDRIERLTVADVQKVAENYLKPSNRTLGEYLPTPLPDRSAIPPAPDVAAMVKDYQGKPALAQGENFDPSPANIEQRTRKLTLDNGAEAALLPKQTRGHAVSGYFSFAFGDAESLAGQRLASRLTAAMLDKGAAGLSQADIANRIEQLKSSLQISGSGQEVRVGFTSQRDTLPQLIDLIARLLREPSFPAAEFDKLREASRTRLAALRDNPQAQAARALGQRLNRYPAGDIRHVPALDEELAELNAVGLEQLRRFHRGFYGAGQARLALVGDFDADAIGRQLNQRFGDWRSAAPYRRLDDKLPQPQAGRQLLQIADKANAAYLAALPLAVQDTDDDYPALLLANHILGGESQSRLFQRLRQQDGLSYSAGSALSVDSRQPVASWQLYAIYAPQNLAKLQRGVGEELARLLRDGVSAQEVADAKRSLLQSAQLGRAQDDTLSRMLSQQLDQGRDMAFQAALERKLQQATPADVNAALRRYLKPASLVEVYAGDFAAKAPAALKRD
ncbi:M16 family metallopeptidase [Chromobacterium subtsugae]|uniref:M16 family metallopeptidase n=1 Tax=Chromobacterium subtsugae TaxID=251747 RepID=UPI0006411521|nr:pitrilysin family protein [Chromobacterium subtsugae]